MAEEHLYGYNPTPGVDDDSVCNFSDIFWQAEVGI